MSQKLAPFLWTLLFLFILRVTGQLLVANGYAPFLPPMEEWFSGAVPYPKLLCSQILIIILLSKVCVDFIRNQGFFVTPHRKLGIGLLTFGSLYLGIMIVRYVIRMSLYPHERWIGGLIPIFFHWILATFLLIVGTYHWRLTKQNSPRHSFIKKVFKFVFILLVSTGIGAWIYYQLAPTIVARQLGLRETEFAVRTERKVPLTTTDGVVLVSDIYHPQRLKKTPTILVRLPLPASIKNKIMTDVICRIWAERGYTIVVQTIRGYPPSGGIYEPFRNERQDGIETLRWIAKQLWFNGKLGMWGGSYFGYTQWVLADQISPGPSALFVSICSTDWHRMLYPGNAFSLASALYWAVWSDRKQQESPSVDFLKPGYEGFPLVKADDRVGRDINYFDQWVTHPKIDDYWTEVNGISRPESLVAPMLMMGGWYDVFLPGMLDDFVKIKQSAQPDVAKTSRLIIGPWAHARVINLPGAVHLRNYRLESMAPSLAWFDQNLENKAVKPPINSPLRIFVMGKNIWRDEQEWPLARTIYTPYYLESDGKANGDSDDGKLELIKATSSEPSDSYVYDPKNPVPTAGGVMLGPEGGITLQNNVEKRSDVLVYTTDTLNDDLEVTGPIKLFLYVSTTAPSTDFTAKLVDVHPDGKAYNISEGILRRDYEVKGQPDEIQIDLWPTSNVFLKGHRIRLEVSSSNYPRFDRNPNTGRSIATEEEPISATQTIFHDQQFSSRLVLPVIPTNSE